MAQPDTITRSSKGDDRRSTVDSTRPAAEPSRPDSLPPTSPEVPASPASNAPPSSMDPEERRKLVEYQAYLLYLERGAEPGFEIDDWLAAEREIDARRG
jgi:hypothetical protein